MRQTITFLLLTVLSVLVGSCKGSTKEAEPIFDGSLLAGEDVSADAGTVEEDTTATIAPLPFLLDTTETTEEPAMPEAGEAVPENLSPQEMYERITDFVNANGDDGIYVFDNDERLLEAPGMRGRYVLVALTTNGGLWAAVSPEGNPSEMEKFRLSPMADDLMRLKDIYANVFKETN